MKIATIVFLVLGMIVTGWQNVTQAMNPENLMPMVNYISIALALVFGILALVFVAQNRKNVAVGVCALLFSGLIGGILYLCWKPDSFYFTFLYSLVILISNLFSFSFISAK